MTDEKAERTAPHLPQRESELLLEINQGLPNDVARRYRDLIARRQAGTLDAGEHEELLRLTNQVEGLEADRLAHLVELARLRRTSLPALMEELGIQPAPDASREDLKRRARALSGRFRSGVSDLSTEHDRYLEEAFGD